MRSEHAQPNIGAWRTRESFLGFKDSTVEVNFRNPGLFQAIYDFYGRLIALLEIIDRGDPFLERTRSVRLDSHEGIAVRAKIGQLGYKPKQLTNNN